VVGLLFICCLVAVYCAHIIELSVAIQHRCYNGRFGDKTDHLMMNELGGELVLEAVYEAQAKLNLLHQNIFPLLPLQRHPPTVSVSANYFYL